MNKKGIFGFIFVFVIILLMIISIVTLVYIKKNVVGYVEYDVDYNIGSVAGFNLDSDAIHFGTVQYGVSAQRDIKINTDRDAVIRIYLYNLEDIWVDKNNFLLLSNETETVELNLEVKENAEEGHYSGKLRILYFVP
ncbi:MAG: hypothetical protein Q8Q42_04025 [Nanoarchaeota archaeon]|nr:hypothetical protein [Nanoarchaeota archaeon]